MRARERTELLLALSCGFTVEGSDGAVGIVETPLFPPDDAAPDFLVVRVGRRRPRRPVVPAALVADVDCGARIVRVDACKADIARLPEHLPIAI